MKKLYMLAVAGVIGSAVLARGSYGSVLNSLEQQCGFFAPTHVYGGGTGISLVNTTKISGLEGIVNRVWAI